MSASSYDQAEIAALLELNFQYLADRGTGSIDKNRDTDPRLAGLDGFEILKAGSFDREIYGDKCPKAIAVRAPDGSIYVHYNGTGDGNWGYNDAAYGGPPSAVQEWSADFFGEIMRGSVEGRNFQNSVYVTGHSQGGNNAQYVTMRSEYGEYITSCISLDGPGFSNQFVEDTLNLYGEAYYNQQRNKIYAYNGESDFVSPLGQTQVIPEDHVRYLEYGDADSFENYHAVDGLFERDGDSWKLKGPEGGKTEQSPLRQFVCDFNARLTERLDPEQQKRAAEIVMKFCEYYLGPEENNRIKGSITTEDLEDFKALLIPLLVETLAEYPEQIDAVMDYLGVPPGYADLISTVIGEFNDLSPEVRKEALDAIAKCVVSDGNGGIKISLENVTGENLWDFLKAAGPMIWETALHHPEDVLKLLKELGVDKKIEEFVKEHPGIAIGVTLLTVLLLPKLVKLAAVIFIIDAVIHIVGALIDIVGAVADFIVKVLTAVKEAIKKIKEWLFKHSAGYRYAQENPWIRVDTDTLREYAQRLRTLNARLVQLDYDMDHLYPQVRLRDLISVFSVNWDTSWSLALARVANDLITTASEFDSAESKACGYMGG